MKIRFSIFLLIIFTYTGFETNIFSQETLPKPSLDKGPIESQFNYVIKNASDFEDSKVVKAWWLYRLKSHVLDSLVSLKDSIYDAYNVIGLKNNHIDSLKTDLLSINKKLTIAVKEKNSLNLLGLNTSKLAYNTILWTIIAGLLLMLVILIVLYRRSNSQTTTTKSNIEEIKEEFEAFRKRALEREQQIAREMYDEIIKYKKKLGEL